MGRRWEVSLVHSKSLRVRRVHDLFGLAVAIALPAGALAALAGAETPASAAELAAADEFEMAFDAMAEPERVHDPRVAAILDQAAERAVVARSDDDDTAEDLGRGNASYYGRQFAGRPTASGERFDPAKLTAAHRTLPFGSKVRVTDPRSGKSVVVRINDRGPFHGNRVIDLSRGAAEKIGLVARGTGAVELALLSS